MAGSSKYLVQGRPLLGTSFGGDFTGNILTAIPQYESRWNIGETSKERRVS